jgi:hypothetical protein
MSIAVGRLIKTTVLESGAVQYADVVTTSGHGQTIDSHHL